MKKLLNLLFMICCVTNFSCDFNINHMPGPQLSWSIDQAKKYKTFICEYKVPGNRINGQPIREIFAERKYSRDIGLLSAKEIDCCESQLLIMSDSIVSGEGRGFEFEWTIKGFRAPHGYAAVANFKGTLFPNTFPITVIDYKNGKRVSTIVKLTKVQE